MDSQNKGINLMETFDTVQFQSKFQELDSLLKEKHPRMPQLLQEIFNTVKQYPEQVTLLSEEQICTLVRGCEVQTGVELAKFVVTSKASSTKSVKAKIDKLGADAF